MIRAAAGDDSRLFQRAQSRRGFASIEDLRLRFADAVDELPGQGCDAAQALKEIQRHALCGQD